MGLVRLVCALLLWTAVWGTDTDTADKASASRLGETSAASRWRPSSESVKSAVFGGLDGIVTTFAIVSGGEGAQVGARLTLVLGASNLFADAVSMGFGDFLSSRAELQHRAADVTQKGRDVSVGQRVLEQTLRETLAGDEQAAERAVARARQLWNEAQAKSAGIEGGQATNGTFAPDEWAEPIRNGLVTMGSFLVFGSIPLLAYTAVGDSNPFTSAILWTALTLTLLGTFQSFVTGQSLIVCGLETLATGEIAAAIAFYIGKFVNENWAEKPAAEVASPRRGRKKNGKKDE